MPTKQYLSLLGNVDNYISLPQSSVDAKLIDDENIKNLIDNLKIFLPKTKTHFAYDIISNQVEKGLSLFNFVSIKYPLPSVVNVQENKILVNTNVWQKKDMLNVNPRDIYSTLVYALAGAYFTKRNIEYEYADTILDFMTAVFIKMYAKKYGLVGSYTHELPKLRFIICVYILVSFFDIPQSSAYKKASNLSKASVNSFDLNIDDYDLRDPRTLIKLLSDSGVLFGISIHEFSVNIIKYFGAITIPAFEDPMRFMATMAGCSVNSTTLFSSSLPRYHLKLYEKIIHIISNSFNKK